MKRFFACFAVFAALIFVISCGGGSSKPADGGDTGEPVKDEDGDTADSEPTDDSEPSDTDPEDPDNPDTEPDNPDSDDPDTTPDNGDSQPEDTDTDDPEDDTDSGDTADEDYTEDITDTGTETGETRVQDCSELPENAQWNTVSAIVQSWDGEKWVPESTAGVYNEAASTTECRFKCKTNYTWSGSACVANTKVSPCMNLPENAQWNTVNSITQTWSGEDWQPSTTGTYNTTSSTTQCRFKCNTNYTWNGSICAADTKVGNCPSKPANTVWNDGGANGTFTQTWNGEDWTPASYDSEYSLTAGICKYKCDTGYAWNNGVCETASTRTAACRSKPDNTVWNTVSEITQTYTGSGWEPSTTPVYNATPSESECRYKCASGYNWNGNSCTDSSVSGSLTLGNICTGQTSCYNASSSMTCPTSSSADFFGQDAQYAAQGTCTPQSFTVQTISSEKVVLDNNTGLMWQQTIPTSTYTWENAVSYCNNLTYASYTDWRLPTPKELLTIVDNSKYDPAIDTTYFSNTPSSYFWSSSTYANDTSSAWRVNFNLGNVYSDNKAYNSYVRCVRGAALPTESFTSSTIQGDVIVTDTETELIWQKTYVSGKTWQQALSYCESLTYAGYSDWRLPNKNELASLINYEKYSPASDFPDMPSNYFWSSSTRAYDTRYAWRVYFSNGYVGNYYKTDNFYVRCVR